MRPDDALTLLRLWRQHTYRRMIPAATVLTDLDWLSYVRAMAATVPGDNAIMFPTRDEVSWAWPDGVTVVFGEPVELGHVIVSEQVDGILGPGVRPVDARQERHLVAGLLIAPPVQRPTVQIGHGPSDDIEAVQVIWVGVDPTDVVSGWWTPGRPMSATLEGGVAESSRFVVALVTALGHRLTRIEQPVGADRGERRRIARELPDLRVLRLATGATVRTTSTSDVEWSRRWMVRGHWRLQPHGPQRSQRRPQWIDPFVKGPEDKPLDVRPTIWRTGSPPA